MNRKVLLILIVTLALGLLAGSALAQKKLNINFPTATTTGTIYPLGAGMANLWNNNIPGIQVTAQASNGGVQNLNLLKNKSAQISFATSGIIYEALHGQGVFKNRAYEDVRIIAGLYYNPNQVVVRGDSGITSLTDLKGKDFAPGASGSTPEVETRVHLTAAGLKYPDDIKPHYVGFTESIDLIRNKQLDGAWIMAGLPTAAVTEITATAGGKLVSMDSALIKKLNENYPWYSEFVIPANTYDGQTEPVTTSAIKMMLIADASVSDDIIYEMVRIFWDNLHELEKSHPVMKQVKLDGAVTDLSGLPLHNGAKRFYMEKGLIN